jgi:hypothetical protein
MLIALSQRERQEQIQNLQALSHGKAHLTAGSITEERERKMR